LSEARKVLIDEMAWTPVTVAKDVKIQVEFNPDEVTSYRLLGYDDRVLAARDFQDDAKDAGDMGSGHAVTALFEVIPHGNVARDATGEPLRFQPRTEASARDRNDSGPKEMLNLKVRYNDPEGSVSKSLELQLVDRGQTFSKASADFRFAAAVAEFGVRFALNIRIATPNIQG
jgi:Ca-activated chloride channel family protein